MKKIIIFLCLFFSMSSIFAMSYTTQCNLSLKNATIKCTISAFIVRIHLYGTVIYPDSHKIKDFPKNNLIVLQGRLTAYTSESSSNEKELSKWSIYNNKHCILDITNRNHLLARINFNGLCDLKSDSSYNGLIGEK